MKPLILSCALSTTLVLLGCSTPGHKKSQVLFDGHPLAQNWVEMHGGQWKIEDGALVGRNGTNWSTNPEKSGSWLRTAKEYKDFILELDYAINTNGNSGVFFRSALDKNPAFTGYEMQIAADYGRPPSNHNSGSLYDVVAPTKNATKPLGEWNHARITARGEHIQIELNGEPILDYHDAKRSPNGYIGLQNHDTRSVVKFKNIKITEL